ncbi:MAG: ATP-binding domain-containing protein [Pararhodobacter sp.]|nr:ATP-binding domain-containing protein [Pararhodobacter sp.]
MAESMPSSSKSTTEYELDEIARDTLDCIESVAVGAEKALRTHGGGRPDAFASVNTFTGGAQVGNLRAISDNERVALQKLIAEPVVARVEFIDEDGKTGTIYITRGSPPANSGYTIATRNSPLSRVASLEPGDDATVRIGGIEREIEILNVTKPIAPQKVEEVWDSRDSVVDLGANGKFTVVSFRELLNPVDATIAEDAWDAWESADQKANVLEGIRRAVLSHMGLRDQPILDRFQDEIFRLPINTRCFLSGPPGTGKTTTLIRRLGQKIDLEDEEALLPTERSLIERASQETGTNHRTSWAMFSPTELLRQYVKEAFAREGFAASDNHIYTWTNFRDAIARDYLRLLRTSTGGGAFQKRDIDSHMDVPSITDQATEWFDDFDTFYRKNLHSGLAADATWLSKSVDPSLAKLGEKLLRAIDSSVLHNVISHMPPELAALQDEIKKHLDLGRNESQRIVTRTLNRLVHDDREFPSALKKEIERQLAQADFEDAEDQDDEIDALEDEESLPGGARTVSREEVKRRYTQAVSTLARAQARRRSVSEKGRSGRLLKWLGETRIPTDDDLKALGVIAASQARLRRFSSFNALVFRSIATNYRKFRSQRSTEGRWYASLPSRSSDISWRELDLLVLLTLRVAGEVMSAYRRMPAADLPEGGILGGVRTLYRNQILVDEATDFSVLQLASMYELSHPLTRSFFMCGDLNQRLTGWGIKSSSEIDWITSDIERRSITVSYRQSGELVRLAKAVATLSGTEPDEIELPERLDIEGVPPVWKMHLTSDADKADWLFERIQEIETIVGKVPTIAVLVNDEQEVEPLAKALDHRLQDINLSAVACKDGKVVGNDRDVRVFNIEYIKGLEFEAVFFTGLDQTIENHPDLYSKYLYVGATRAATYLGITFSGKCPDLIESLHDHFRDAWET